MVTEICGIQSADKGGRQEILVDYPARRVRTLEELTPVWWGWKRYQELDQEAN